MKSLYASVLVFFTIPLMLFSQQQPISTNSTPNEDKAAYVCLPAGASMNLDLDAATKGNAGGIIGIEYSKSNTFFLSILFNYAGNARISGGPKNFGSFLLNPISNGSTFILSGNRLFPVKAKNKLIKNTLIGVGWCVGASLTEWEAPILEETKIVEGQILYFSPSFILCSSEIKFGNQDESFQWGGTIGPVIRWITGDLGQANAFRKDNKVLGVEKKNFIGLEASIFLRINKLKPFIRFSYVGSKNPIAGFSDFRVLFGFDIVSSLFKGKVIGP